MSAVKERVTQASRLSPATKGNNVPIFNRILDFLSSVKLGVVLLCIMVFFAFLGMIVIQQNVQGFDVFYASLTPAEKTVYGFLGLFNIYYSWYFKALLLILSLNIVLASIDRFPSAWSYISRPKLDGSRKWFLGQKSNAEVHLDVDSQEKAVARISSVFKKYRLKPKITEKKGKLFVFGESGKWNRLGAYIVHVALLTLFLGHFVALQTGFDADVRFAPGETKNEIQLIETVLDQQNRFAVALPFTIKCTDIQQKLIDPAGQLGVNNTLDWRTQIEINDPKYGVTTANVALNKPFSYRGFRFLQAQTVPVGNARKITLELTPDGDSANPVKVTIQRNGKTELKDGTVIEYKTFLPDFAFNQKGQPDTKSGDYNNPAAVLMVTPKGGEKTRVFAFGGNIADKMPVGASKIGYKWRLASFEKAPLAHILSIKYDPYNGAFIAWYFGGFGLIGALVFVFFVSHRRVWALIEKSKLTSGFNVVLGGHTNRNHMAFEYKFDSLTKELRNKGGKP